MIAPIDCKHPKTFSIESGRIVSTAEHSEHHVYLCEDCGKFLVVGHQNEEHYRFSFYLVREDHLEAASKPVKYFNQER